MRPATHSGSRSMCGEQVLSHKLSSPSFSFGCGPARLAIPSRRSAARMLLQPSVSESVITPGPIYNPSLASKRQSAAPSASFRRSIHPSSSSALARGLSRPPLASPGPAAYELASSLVAQPLARCATPAAYSFTSGRPEARPPDLSPGPIYVIPARVSRAGRGGGRAYSFGCAVRSGCAPPPRDSSPGPGMYTPDAALSSGGSSAARGGPQRAFRGNCIDRGVARSCKDSPGPIYPAETSACSKQVVSARRSAPAVGFGRALRFTDREAIRSACAPGPGDYLI
ncbi:hypothetical protein AB1Y20_013380 [Prymnesium parvum]|uniref:Uncharacterized protein n=1 Tax=Prymnesium parvum TaxID=97485 RepID=A0AB34IFM0_PRYPA